jgi:hypothetical protein
MPRFTRRMIGGRRRRRGGRRTMRGGNTIASPFIPASATRFNPVMFDASTDRAKTMLVNEEDRVGEGTRTAQVSLAEGEETQNAQASGSLAYDYAEAAPARGGLALQRQMTAGGRRRRHRRRTHRKKHRKSKKRTHRRRRRRH